MPTPIITQVTERMNKKAAAKTLSEGITEIHEV
jgi:hypothetical protein